MPAGRPDVVVVGGGIIGLAVARELARRGHSVALVERGSPGREATWAAAGMLSPLGEAAQDPALHRLADASLDLWPELASALLEETGADVAYRTDGAIHVAERPDEVAALHALAARAGSAARLIEDGELRALLPGLSEHVSAGLRIERDHTVDNRRAGQVLWSAAVGAGVDFRLGVTAVGLDIRAGAFAAVLLAGGGTLEAGACVLSAGAWSADLDGLPGLLPVKPVRGQMFSVDSNAGRLPGALVTPDCYLVPRPDGRILVGATVERVGFTPGPTPGGIAGLIAAASRVLPALLGRPLTETWAGYRPGTPDDLPILGSDPDAAGLFHATGHFRNGILLAPITARLLADAVEGTATPTLDPFSVARFRS